MFVEMVIVWMLGLMALASPILIIDVCKCRPHDRVQTLRNFLGCFCGLSLLAGGWYSARHPPLLPATPRYVRRGGAAEGAAG